MIRRPRVSVLGLFVSTGLLLAACKDDVAPAPLSSAPAPIVFGVSLDTTGASAASGLAMSTAIRVAEAQVNAAGGIGGRPVSFLFLNDNDASDEVLQARIQTELLDKGAIAILGPIRSSQIKAAAAITVGVVPLISPSGTAVSLSALNPDPADKWIYRTIPSDETQVRAMIKFADEGLQGRGGGCKKLAIASAPDAYGEGFRTGLVAEWPKVSGASLAAQVSLPDSSPDLGPLVRQIAASDPDCLALVQVEGAGAAFALAMRKEISSTPTLFREGFFVVGSEGLNNDGFLTGSRTDPASSSTCTAEGFFGTAPIAREDPAHAEYMALHRQFERRAADPDLLGAHVAGSYDAAALLVLARAASGSDDPVALRDALDAVSEGGTSFTPARLPDALIAAAAGDDIDYKGATGNVNFTPKGDVAGGYKVWVVQNGAFATVGQLPEGELEP